MPLSFPIRGPSVQRMVKELGIPLGSAQIIKQAMEHGRAKTALTLANEAMKGYGVESLWPEYPNLSYVNMGDTYERTLIYTGKSFQIGSWGDHVEGHRGVAHDGSNPRDSKYWKADPRWAKRGPVKHPFQNDLGRQHIVRDCKNCVFYGKECDGSIYPECRSYAAPADIKRLVARRKQAKTAPLRAETIKFYGTVLEPKTIDHYGSRYYLKFASTKTPAKMWADATSWKTSRKTLVREAENAKGIFCVYLGPKIEAKRGKRA